MLMSIDNGYWVYILASRIGGMLYIGVTNNLVRRVYEHRMGLAEGFTKQYGVHRLVYFEQFDDIEQAILHEKRLKKWERAWKIQLIEENNPNWDDLYPRIARP
jgi:putative endonuclease